MKDQVKKHPTPVQRFVELCRSAAAALGISDGEFWVWYGNPFILQQNFRQ